MPINTRPPSLPSVQTGMTYQDYLKKYMDQFGVSSQPYDVTAGQVAPQSPMQVNPAQIAGQVAKGALAREGASQLATTAAENELWNQGANQATQAAWNAGADAATQAAAGQVAPTGFSLSGIGANAASMGAGPIAGILAGTYLGGKSALDMLKGKNDKSLPGLAGRATLGIATGGLSELARPFLMRKSIKEQVQDRWKGLAGSTTNQPTLNYIDQYRKYLDSDQQKIDAQYPNTFAGKKAAGTLTGKDVWGGAGMFKTFGDDWLGKYSEGQREAISNELLKRNLVESKKGDINITDAGAAQTAASDILKLLSAPASAAPRVAIPRSSTLSPGIRKDGTRIDYSKKRK